LLAGEVSIGSVDFELNVIVDRELITSQNPRSDHPIATKPLEVLASSQNRGLAAGRD
jgi:putative intracellular protease/amidase